MPADEFLIVDDHEDNRFLLSRTLIRKFPQALLQECQDSEPALVAMRRGVTAAIVHRALDMDALPLVEALRKANPTVPILFVSGSNRNREAAFSAGANAFLHYDAWLRLGTAVEEMLSTFHRDAAEGRLR